MATNRDFSDKMPRPNSIRKIFPIAMRTLAEALDKSGRKNGQPHVIKAGRKMAVLAKKSMNENQFHSPRSAKNEGTNKPFMSEQRLKFRNGGDCVVGRRPAGFARHATRQLPDCT